METFALLQSLEMLTLLQMSGNVEVAGQLIGVGLAAGVAAVGAGAGMGILFGRIAEAVARQPEAEDRLRFYLFLGLGLVEAFALYGIVFALLIAFVLGP